MAIKQPEKEPKTECFGKGEIQLKMRYFNGKGDIKKEKKVIYN